MFHAGTILLLVVTSWIGWQLGSLANSSSPPREAPGHGSEKELRSANHKRLSAEERLIAIREATNPEERWRSTIAMARSLDPSEFPDWTASGWFRFREGFELTMFRRIIEERWRDEDPDGYLLWVMENGGRGPVWSSDITTHAAVPVLTRMADRDPGRLETFFARYPDEILESRLLDKLVRDNPARSLSYLRSSGFAPAKLNRELEGAINGLATADPSALEAALPELPVAVRGMARKALEEPSAGSPATR